MKEIIYLSEGNPDFSHSMIDKMIERAREFNQENNITGALICDQQKRFIQVLEGDSDVIDALYSRIQDDNRHTSVLLIHEESITERTFGHWSMAYKNSSADFTNLEFYNNLCEGKYNAESVELIKQFYLHGN